MLQRNFVKELLNLVEKNAFNKTFFELEVLEIDLKNRGLILLSPKIILEYLAKGVYIYEILFSKEPMKFEDN